MASPDFVSQAPGLIERVGDRNVEQNPIANRGSRALAPDVGYFAFLDLHTPAVVVGGLNPIAVPPFDGDTAAMDDDRSKSDLPAWIAAS